ncbi:MAG: hypothetical protein GY856_04455, partial [bacterium]|nr:hypothetical protein [bacterium]
MATDTRLQIALLTGLLTVPAVVLAAAPAPQESTDSQEYRAPAGGSNTRSLAFGFVVDPERKTIRTTTGAAHWWTKDARITATDTEPRKLKKDVELSITEREDLWNHEDSRLTVLAKFKNETKSQIYLQGFFFEKNEELTTEGVILNPDAEIPEIRDTLIVYKEDLGNDGILDPGEETSILEFEVDYGAVLAASGCRYVQYTFYGRYDCPPGEDPGFDFYVDAYAKVQKTDKPPCEECCKPCRGCADGQDMSFDGCSDLEVSPHSGELTYSAVDLEISGRGFNWRFERSYRSIGTLDGTPGSGPLGYGWEINYSRRLVEVNPRNLGQLLPIVPSAELGDVVDVNGQGRADLYSSDSDGNY